MKRNVALLLMLAVVVGAVVGFFVRGQFGVRQKVAGSTVLTELSFAKFMEQVDASAWLVVEDRVDDAFPPLSQSPRVARRIVAQTTLLKSDQKEFATRFQKAAEDWLTSHGATIKGQQDATHSSAEVVAEGQYSSLIDLPRKYYALGEINGVADFGCVLDSGRGTVVVSIIEGP